MRKAMIIAILAIVVVGTMSSAYGAEWRALWIDGWHSGMWTQAEIDQLFDGWTDGSGYHKGVIAGNYNIIVPQIRKKGDALYNSTYGGPYGTGEPKPSQVQPPSFDPLAYMIQRAHAAGIQVHPWVCTHRVPTTTSDWFYTMAPFNTWLTKNQAGTLVESEGYYLDPGVPDGEEYTVNVILDIVRNYDIDGIQWDRIRYPAEDSGYNTIAINRFQQEYGYFPNYTDSTFKQWKRKQLNDFVARVYAQIMEIKPHVVVGANTWVTYSNGNTIYCQDANAWMYNHWLDVNNPMTYTSSNTSLDSYVRDWMNRRYGRYCFPAMNIGVNTHANGVTQLQLIRSIEDEYFQPWGEQTYSWYYASVTKLGWFEYVTASSSRPYYTKTTVPTLPWKTNPTTGIILGRVTDASHPNDPVYHDWVYKATVTLYHPGTGTTRSTTTDQTGYFVFTDVTPRPQGSGYQITVSKPGFPDRVYTNQAIAAGQVLREDFELGTTTVSSPAGTANAPWALVSVPLPPVNPDPAVVFGGVNVVDGMLYRWDKNAQSMIVYDAFNPDEFGNVKVEDGYWLNLLTNRTISYQAYAGTPATYDVSLPKAGWAIIGCPFLKTIDWEDTLVTQGTTTVSMYEASRSRNWLNSMGYWWDSTTQALVDFGIADDFPSSTTLRPWHGHWVQSYSDNLTLTLR